MRHPQKFACAILFVFTLFAPQVARAETFSLFLNPSIPPPPPISFSTGIAAAIGSVTINGTLTNNTGVTLTANNTFLNVTGNSLPFGFQSLITSENFSLPNGATSPPGPLFSITLGEGYNPDNVYTVLISYIGNGIQSNIITYQINGDTITVVQAVPEPTTMILLATGLAGVAARIRKRSRTADSA